MKQNIESDASGARTAMATALAAELGMDTSQELLVAVDRLLIRLYLIGYIVALIPEEIT